MDNSASSLEYDQTKISTTTKNSQIRIGSTANRKRTSPNHVNQINSKSKDILIHDAYKTWDKVAPTSTKDNLSQPSNSNILKGILITDVPMLNNNQSTFLENKMLSGQPVSRQQRLTDRTSSKALRTSSDDMKPTQGKQNILEKGHYQINKSNESVRMQLNFDDLTKAEEPFSSRKAITSRNLAARISPYYKRPIESNKTIKISSNTEISQNEMEKPLSIIADSMLLSENNKTKELKYLELVQTKLRQERARRALFQGLESTFDRKESRERSHRELSMSKTKDLKISNKKSVGVILLDKQSNDPPVSILRTSTRFALTDRLKVSPYFEQKLEDSKADFKPIDLMRDSVSSPSKLIFRQSSQEGMDKPEAKKMLNKKHELKPDKVLEIAKQHIFVRKHAANYTKLLRETFHTNFNRSDSNNNGLSPRKAKENECHEAAYNYLIKKNENNRSKVKFDRLMKMDIGRKITTLKETVENYRVYFY